MTRLHRIILFCLSLLLVTSIPLRAEDMSGIESDRASHRLILSISDIHFDPFNTTDTTIPAKLIKHPYTDWESIFSASSDKDLSIYGQDTNFNLLESVLIKMRSTCANPDFILFSGDILGHYFSIYQQKYFPNNESGFHKFVMKTLKFIGLEFDKYFPGVSVICTLGNNDAYVDFGIVPNGSFLRDSHEIYFNYMHQPSGNKKAFDATFLHGGNYSMLPTPIKANRIVSINNIFFSQDNKYKKQGWVQLEWLQSQLKAATANNEKIWLMLHMPPGVCVEDSVNAAGKKSSHLVDYWDTTVTRDSKTFLDKFNEIIRKYASNIKAIYAGHTHMDHFRLIFDKKKPISYVHITPAVTPWSNNNPAFQVMTYNLRTFSILNVDTWYYQKTSWKKEYNFDKTYKISSLTPSTLNAVSTRIKDKSETRQFFMDYYDVNNPSSLRITKKNWKAYWCGIGALREADFNACYK